MPACSLSHPPLWLTPPPHPPFSLTVQDVELCNELTIDVVGDFADEAVSAESGSRGHDAHVHNPLGLDSKTMKIVSEGGKKRAEKPAGAVIL